MNTRTSILAVTLAAASISTLATTSASAWSGPRVAVPKAVLAAQIAHARQGVPKAVLAMQIAHARGVWHPSGIYRPYPVYPTHWTRPLWRPSYRPIYVPSTVYRSPVVTYRQTYPVAPSYAPSYPVAPSYAPTMTYAPQAPCTCEAPAPQPTYVQPTYAQPTYVEAQPAAAPCDCETPAQETTYVQPTYEAQPAAAPCDCEEPAQQVYAQPQAQMEMPAQVQEMPIEMETAAPMDREMQKR
jgi:hypothetical protein